MPDPNPPAESFADPHDVHNALHRTMLYGVLPLWIVPGFLDYLAHRRSKIEQTAGTHESLLHNVQMATLGLPITMTLLLRVNAPVIVVSIACTIAHELLTLWDIAYAEPLRRPTPNEQHVHSFLEATPISALGSILALHPDETAALFGRGNTAPDWRLRLKEPALDRRYLGAVFAAVTLFLAIPYAEEFVRCWRVDRTLGPRPRPAGEGRDAA